MTYFFGSNIHVSNIRPIVAVVDTSNQQWKRCDNDANLAVLSYDHTDVDYAWLCNASAYVKAYNGGATASVATNPTVLKQCGVTPTSCSDLVGWPLSDDFSGTGCNSGSVGDTPWGIRWPTNTVSAGSSQTIVGGELRQYIPAGGGSYLVRAKSPTISESGDFRFQSDFDLTPATTDGQCDIRINLSGFAGPTSVLLSHAPNSATIQFTGRINGSTVNSSTTATSGALRLRRVSGTVYCDYNIGAGWVNITSASASDTCTAVDLTTTMDFSSDNVTNLWDNFVGVGAGDADIYADPTGTAC